MIQVQKMILFLIFFTCIGCYTQVRAPEVGRHVEATPPATQDLLPPLTSVQPYSFNNYNFFDGDLYDPYDFRRNYYRDRWGYWHESTTRFVPNPDWLWDYGFWRTRQDPWYWGAARTVWVPVYVGAYWQPRYEPVSTGSPSRTRPQVRRTGVEGPPASASDIRQEPPVSTPTVVNPPPVQTPQTSGSTKQTQEEKKEEKTEEEKREEKRSDQRRRGGMQ